MMRVLLLFLLVVFQNSTVLADAWIQRTDFPGVGRHRATAMSIGNRIYMGLGHYNGTGVETYLNDWWEYDPSTGAWTQKANFIGNNGNGELGAHGMRVENIGFVGLGELDKHSLYKFDPVLNTWTEVTGPGTNTNFQDTGDFIIGDKGYFMNLYNGKIHVYDATLDQWEIKNSVPFTPTFSYSGFAINGKGYMKTQTALFEYDPATDTWTNVSTFPGVARLSSMSFVQNEKAYIVCGYQQTHSEVTSEVWEYNPSTNSWTQFPNFPGLSRRYACGITFGNRAFIGTGTNGTNFRDFWEFDGLASLEDEAQTPTFDIFPVPASMQVTFQSELQHDFEVRIYDSAGRILLQKKAINGLLSIQVDHLDSGVYHYSISQNGRHLKTGKIQVQ